MIESLTLAFMINFNCGNSQVCRTIDYDYPEQVIYSEIVRKGVGDYNILLKGADGYTCAAKRPLNMDLRFNTIAFTKKIQSSKKGTIFNVKTVNRKVFRYTRKWILQDDDFLFVCIAQFSPKRKK